MSSDTKEKDEAPPRRPSSWSAALAQLPGYPSEDKPKLPQVGAASIREVSWDEDGIKEH